MTTSTLETVSPPLALLLSALRWPAETSDITNTRALLSAGLADPELFLWLVRRHRVAPLALRGLTAAKADVESNVVRRLIDIAEVSARNSLLQIAETGRIAQDFAKADIPVVTVKGVTLSVLAFRNPTLRDAKDIDLVVRPEDLGSAEATLDRLGYRRTDPDFALTPRQYRAFLRCGRHFEYRHVSFGQLIELHWRFSENEHLFPLKLERNNIRQIQISNGMVPSLPFDDLFLYLCVHGAEHVWFRLKWLADVAALLRGAAKNRIADITRRAVALGVSRHLGQALVLAHRLLAAPIPADVLAEYERDRMVRKLVRDALRAIQQGEPPGDPTELPFFSTRNRLHRIRLGRGWPYYAQELRSSLQSLDDWNTFRLPDPLFGFYPLLRPVAWLPRVTTRVCGRIANRRI